MRVFHATLVTVMMVGACEANPPLGPEGDHEVGLFTELSISSSHVHTLSPITFSVSVRDEHQNPVTDFEMIQVERLYAGTDTWRGAELTLNGSAYEASYTFATSGEYELRVVGQRHGQTEMSVLYEMPEHLQVGRAHLEAGDYRIEFETFPGHIHKGDAAIMKFWVTEAEKNPDGTRPAVPGLTLDIHCFEAGSLVEEHEGEELEPGVYQAMHEFHNEGEFRAETHFAGAEAAFSFHVSGTH